MQKFASFLVLSSFLLCVSSCKKETVDSISCTSYTSNTTANSRYSVEIKGILASKCVACHQESNAKGGVRLDNYGQVKTYVDNKELLGTIAHLSGYEAMPQGGSKLSQEDICKIKFWIDNGAPNN